MRTAYCERHYLSFAPLVLVPAFTIISSYLICPPDSYTHTLLTCCNAFPEPHVLRISGNIPTASGQWPLTVGPCFPSSPKLFVKAYNAKVTLTGTGGATKLSVTSVLNPFLENSKRQVNSTFGQRLKYITADDLITAPP